MTSIPIILLGALILAYLFVVTRRGEPKYAGGSSRENKHMTFIRSQVATTPYRGFSSGRTVDTTALDRMQMLRDSETNEKNNERNFLIRDLNFTDRELLAFDKINDNHQQAIKKMAINGAKVASEALTLVAQRDEALIRLIGIKRFQTYKSYRKSKNTKTV